MKWYKHLLLYFLSCAFVELILLMHFAFAAITENDNSVWADFYLPQIGLPIFGASIWLLMEIVIGYNEKLMREGEFLEKLNERLKDKTKKEKKGMKKKLKDITIGEVIKACHERADCHDCPFKNFEKTPLDYRSNRQQ